MFAVLRIFPMWLPALSLIWEIYRKIQKSFFIDKSLMECTTPSLIIRIMREQSFTSHIKNRAVTDPSRKQVIPTCCKAAIAKYFLSILKGNLYLTCTSKED